MIIILKNTHTKVNYLFYIYFKYFLLLDILMGYFLKYKRMDIPVNPGQVVRGVLLLMLIVIFFFDVQKRLTRLGAHFLIIITFVCVFLSVVLVQQTSFYLLMKEIGYLSKILFILLLLCYVIKHCEFFSNQLDNIMFINFVIFSSTISVGYFFNLGLSTYSYIENTSKGMFYGGNPTSVLCLVFFTYYLFTLKFELKGILILLVSLFNIHAISTKAVFVVPLIVSLFVYEKLRAGNFTKKIMITYSLIPVVLLSTVILKPVITEMYHKRYSKVVMRAYRGYLTQDRVFESYLTLPFEMIATRRVAAAKMQMQYLMDNPTHSLFGIGHVGQVKFWMKDGHTYHDSSMDLFDLLFMYGVLGTTVIFYIIIKTVYYTSRKFQTDRDAVILLLIFMYSIFGGHVISTTTSGTMLALFTGIRYHGAFPRNVFQRRLVWLKS